MSIFMQVHFKFDENLAALCDTKTTMGKVLVMFELLEFDLKCLKHHKKH